MVGVRGGLSAALSHRGRGAKRPRSHAGAIAEPGAQRLRRTVQSIPSSGAYTMRDRMVG